MREPLNDALDAQAFARLIEKCAPLSDKIAVAVSGGPDSMALAFCLKRWGMRPLLALIVDHQLRPESGDEAQQVKKNLAQIGIEAEILTWRHEAITGRLHEKARAARYHLLGEACHKYGIADLFTAHHRDDQAETILMRIAKGSGVDGLAGIAAQSRRGALRLLRPFLPVGKKTLVATCEKENLPFVTDPSNASSKFARGRLRAIMPALEQEGMTRDNLILLGARAAEAAQALEHTTRLFLRDHARAEKGGSIRLDRAALRTIPRAIALRALSACLRHIHPDDYPPEYEALSDLLDAILTSNEAGRTLHSCIVDIGESRVHFLREAAAASAVLSLLPGQTLLWDGRWLVHAAAEAAPCTLRALGNPPHETVDNLAPRLRRDVPQGRVRATLPALWQGELLYAIPAFADADLGPDPAFSARYRKEAFP